MNCSATSKIMLIRAALDGYDGPTFKEPAQRELGESLFWVCDSLEEDWKLNQDQASKHNMSHLFLIKHFANEMVKRRLTTQELAEVRAECVKLFMGTIA